MLATFASCSGGGGSGSANFEINRGFATGNEVFTGGLYIHGRNTRTGEQFSFALDLEQKASLSLSFGTWDIRAVAWDGDPESDAFEGNVLCSHEVVNFNSNNQAVRLQVTNDKCEDPAFATVTSNPSTSFIRQVDGQYEFKPLTIYTCGALYDTTKPTQLLSSTSFTADFCSYYPLGFQQKAAGVIVTLQSLLPGKLPTDGLSSSCMSADQAIQAAPISTFMKLPTKIPVTISLFEDPNCNVDSLISKFDFSEGLESTVAKSARNFDAITAPTYSNTALALPSEMPQRGTTPLSTELPFFKCNFAAPTDKGDACLNMPPLPGIADYIVSPGYNLIKIPGNDCSAGDITSPSSSINGLISYNDCILGVDGTSAYLSFMLSMSATEGAASFNFGSTINIYIRKNFTNVMKGLRDSIGWGNQTSTDNSLASLSDDKDQDGDWMSGVIGDIQSPFGPIFMGGFFWDVPCTTTPLPAPIKKTMTLNEDGQQLGVMIIVTNPPPHTVPGYIADSNNPKGAAISNIFHRRYILRKLVDSVTGHKTELVIDIACDGTDTWSTSVGSNARIGRLEEIKDESSADAIRNERSLIYWNTTYPHNSRFEEYRYTDDYNPLTSIINFESSFIRGEKFAGTNSNDLKVTGLYYSYRASTIESSEEIHHSEDDITGLKLVTHKTMPDVQIRTMSGSPDPIGSIFNNGLYEDEKERIRYGTNIRMENQVGAFKAGPSGKYIHAYPNAAGSKLVIDFHNGNTLSSQEITYNAEKVAVDISFDGTKAIVVASGSADLIFYVWNGSTWINGSASTSAVETLDTGILNNAEFLIAVRKSDKKLYLGSGDTSNPPSTLPSALNMTSFHSGTLDVVQEFALIKTSILAGGPETFHLVMNTLNTTTNYRLLSTCSYTHSSPGCSENTVTSASQETGWVMNLSAHNSNDGKEIIISYAHASAPPGPVPTQYISTRSADRGTTWSNPVIYDANDYNIMTRPAGYDVFDMADVTKGIGSGLPPTPVMVPYIPPVVPNFKMNYNSLNPTEMEKVFTPRSVFENIGDDL